MGETLKHFIRLFRNGRSLRHRPVVWPGPDQVRVDAEFEGSPKRVDVTNGHTPISLQPFVIGLRVEPSTPLPARARLFFTDTGTGATIGQMALRATSEIEHENLRLGLYQATATHNGTAGLLEKTWRYFLAYRQARHTRTAPGIRMSTRDAIALNLYYSVPRPVFLIGTSLEGQKRLFPMDLLSTIDGHQILALRALSATVPVIEQSRIIAMSAAPANSLEAIHKCGRWPLEPSTDLSKLPLRIRYLETGCPVLDEHGEVRQVKITYASRHGSHMVFIGNVLSSQGTMLPQVAHMSDMYVNWLQSRHRALQPLTDA